MWVHLCKFWNSISNRHLFPYTSFPIHHPSILHYIFWATDSVLKLPWLVQVAGCCKHSNEPLALVKHEELPNQQNEWWLSWERLVTWQQKCTTSYNMSNLIHRDIILSYILRFLELRQNRGWTYIPYTTQVFAFLLSPAHQYMYCHLHIAACLCLKLWTP